jgi:hypothetical protein
VVDIADDFGDGGAVGFPVLAHEEGDEVAIAGIEVEMDFLGDVEVRLLENEGHAEDTLVEIDGVLPVGPDEGDVVDAGGGDVHVVSSARWAPVSRCAWRIS